MNDLQNRETTALQSMSTDDLKSLLAHSVQVTARHLQYLAAIWVELERRGEDLSSMRAGILEYLPMIANHRIDARVVVNYAGQKTLLAALSRLPIETQSSIVESGYVTVVSLDHDGSHQDLQTPLNGLTARQVYQVFADDRLRTPAEQYKLLAAKEARTESTRSRSPRKSRRVKVENGVLIVSSAAADLDRVIDALSEHYGVDIRSVLKKSS